MIKIIDGRKTGKTEKAIYMSSITEYPILAANNMMAGFIKTQAKHLGVSIPEPLSVHQLRNSDGMRGKKKLIVDEADLVLYEFCKNHGFDVAAYTLSTVNRELDRPDSVEPHPTSPLFREKECNDELVGKVVLISVSEEVPQSYRGKYGAVNRITEDGRAVVDFGSLRTTTSCHHKGYIARKNLTVVGELYE